MTQPKPAAAIWTKQFWKDALDRALKSFANGAIIGIVLSIKGAQTFTGIPWADVLILATFATILSVLMSVGSIPFGSKGTASAIKGIEYLGTRIDKGMPPPPPAVYTPLPQHQPIEAVYTPPPPGNPPLPNWTPPPAPPVPSAAPPLPAQFVAPAAEYVGRHRAKEPGNAAP